MANLPALPADFPIAPSYVPLDVTNSNDLSHALVLARSKYNIALLLARSKRRLWAVTKGQNLAGEAEFVDKVANQTTLAPLYEPFRLDHDAVFDEGPVFFMYGSEQHIMDMVNGGGLRVSEGADLDKIFQKGTFPKGVYATVVAPSRDDITQGVLSRFFSTTEWAHPNVPRTGVPQHPGFDVSYFLMFAPNANWTTTGYLQYRRVQVAFTKVDHWVMKSGAAPGTIVSYDIIAYGRSRIPTSIEEMNVFSFTPGDRALAMSTLTS